MSIQQTIQPEIGSILHRAFEIRKSCQKCKRAFPIFNMVCPSCAEPLTVRVNAAKLAESIEQVFSPELGILPMIQSILSDADLQKYLEHDCIRRVFVHLETLFEGTEKYYRQLAMSSAALHKSLSPVVKTIEAAKHRLAGRIQDRMNPFHEWLGEYQGIYDVETRTGDKPPSWKFWKRREPKTAKKYPRSRDMVKQIMDAQTQCNGLYDKMAIEAEKANSLINESFLQQGSQLSHTPIGAIRRQLEIEATLQSLSHCLDFIPEFISVWRQNHE